MVESGRQQFSPHMKTHTFKVLDFALFDRFIRHNTSTWVVILVSFLFTFLQLPLVLSYLTIPKTSEYTFATIMLIVPIYYLSRLVFAPLHECGHYVFYYLFTGKSATMYIQIPGFLYFGGITTADDLFYIPDPFKRIIISLAGVYTELLTLTFIITFFQSVFTPFILQLVTVRVFVSIIFNLNIFSQSTDGLITDLLGFPTFAETYSDVLRQFLNPSFIPVVQPSQRIKGVCVGYTIIGIGLIGLLFFSQGFFFLRIIQVLLIPLTQLQTGISISIFEGCCILLTYLYYLDVLVRVYRKKIILQQIIKIKNNQPLT